MVRARFIVCEDPTIGTQQSAAKLVRHFWADFIRLQAKPRDSGTLVGEKCQLYKRRCTGQTPAACVAALYNTRSSCCKFEKVFQVVHAMHLTGQTTDEDILRVTTENYNNSEILSHA